MTVIEQETVYTEAPVVTTRDVLHRAGDLIEEFDHCFGEFGSKSKGQFCAAGAIMQAERDFGAGNTKSWEFFANHLNFKGLHGGCRDFSCVACWNDAPGRTKEEVVAKLREAAEAA